MRQMNIYNSATLAIIVVVIAAYNKKQAYGLTALVPLYVTNPNLSSNPSSKNKSIPELKPDNIDHGNLERIVIWNYQNLKITLDPHQLHIIFSAIWKLILVR